MRAGVVFIERDRFFVGGFGVLPLQQARVGVADLHVDSGEARVQSFRGEQGFKRAAEVAAAKFDSRPKQLVRCASRLRRRRRSR